MITIALSFHHNIFLEDIQYMTILSREERERLVIELYYNHGKTYRQISKEARISPRDIGVILNKTIGGKTEESKEEQDNIEPGKNQEQHQQQNLSLSTQAYKLFSEGKNPLEVAIALNLRESDATKFCREYWKLKRLHVLNSIFKETKGKASPFSKLYKLLIKQRGISIEKVVNVVDIAANTPSYGKSL
jgi:transposase